MSFARRLIRNTFANWIGLAVGALASFILAPYLIGYLGPERFGLYQISRQFVAYLILFDLGILGAVMRFCADGVAAGNDVRVNAVANSALVIYSAIAIAGLALCLAAGSAAPDFFRVDPAYVEETRLLFWGLGVWWAVTMLGDMLSARAAAENPPFSTTFTKVAMLVIRSMCHLIIASGSQTCSAVVDLIKLRAITFAHIFARRKARGDPARPSVRPDRS